MLNLRSHRFFSLFSSRRFSSYILISSYSSDVGLCSIFSFLFIGEVWGFTGSLFLQRDFGNCPSAICWKEYPFFIELHWHLCRKWVETVSVGVRFWILSLFHWCIFLSLWCCHTTLITVPLHYFLKWGSTNSSCVLFQIILAILDSLYFHVHFRISLVSPEEKKSEFW